MQVLFHPTEGRHRSLIRVLDKLDGGQPERRLPLGRKLDFELLGGGLDVFAQGAVDLGVVTK